MDLDFTEEQKLLRQAARDFLNSEFPKTKVRQMEADPTGFQQEFWKKVSNLGWLGLIIPEEFEGSGGSLMDLMVLTEEMGRACFISPFFPTTVCARSILNAGTDGQKTTFLPKMANGEVIFSPAITETSARYDAIGINTTAEKQGERFIINGTKMFVQSGITATHFLLAARTSPHSQSSDEGISLFIIDSKQPGVQVNPVPTMGDDKQCELIFKNAAALEENMLGTVDRGWSLAEKLIEFAAILKCAEMIGGADWTLETCVTYVKERMQFGKPIASFQILQHYLAEMWAEIGLTKNIVYKAAWLMNQGLPCTKEVAMAKARMNDGYKHWTRMGVQIHGGIGTTRDHDMGLYYRRARQAFPLFGASDHWKENSPGKYLAGNSFRVVNNRRVSVD